MLKLWIYCLIRANHAETEMLVEKQEIKLYPGQFVTGRYVLAEDYNRGSKKRHRVSPNTLWRWLQKFKEWGMLDIKSTNKYSIITIKNWRAYQQIDQQMGNKWTTAGQQMYTDKNVKNDKDIVPTEQPNGCEKPPRDIIAELIRSYRSISGIHPKKNDHPFFEKMLNDYGSGAVYAALQALKKKAERGPVEDPYSYLIAIANVRYKRTKSKITPLRRKEQLRSDNNLPKSIREQIEMEERGETWNTDVDPEVQAEILEELNRMRKRFEEKRTV